MSEFDFYLRTHHQFQTLIGQSVHLSIKVHGIYIPSPDLQKRLHEFAHILVNYTHDENYQVRFIGSATGIAFEGRQVLVATRHQIKDCRIDDIGILRLDNNSYLSSSGVVLIKELNNSHPMDEFDLCSFNYTSAAGNDRNLKRNFFLLDEKSILRDDDNPIFFLAYGYPFDHQKYEIFDKNNVGLVSKAITCQPINLLFDEMLGSCQTLANMDFNPDGLSGGPVFATVLNDHEIVLKFAGIINRAGNNFIHFIKAEAVVRLLKIGLD